MRLVKERKREKKIAEIEIITIEIPIRAARFYAFNPFMFVSTASDWCNLSFKTIKLAEKKTLTKKGRNKMHSHTNTCMHSQEGNHLIWPKLLY